MNLCHRGTMWTWWTAFCERYTREQDGRLNCSDQAEMTLQTHQFYNTVTFCLCGTEREQIQREAGKWVGEPEIQAHRGNLEEGFL
jgi:hypothetical protein